MSFDRPFESMHNEIKKVSFDRPFESMHNEIKKVSFDRPFESMHAHLLKLYRPAWGAEEKKSKNFYPEYTPCCSKRCNDPSPSAFKLHPHTR